MSCRHDIYPASNLVPARTFGSLRNDQVDTESLCKHTMSNISTKPSYVSLHRLCQLSGRSRATLLLRMRDGELVADAMLDVGGRPMPLFAAGRIAELKNLPLRHAAPMS